MNFCCRMVLCSWELSLVSAAQRRAAVSAAVSSAHLLAGIAVFEPGVFLSRMQMEPNDFPKRSGWLLNKKGSTFRAF